MMQIQSEAIKLLSRHEHGDTVTLQWLVELETKVAEDYVLQLQLIMEKAPTKREIGTHA